MADLLKKESPIERYSLEEGGSILFYVIIVIFFLVTAGYGGLLLLNNAQDRVRAEIIAQVQAKEETVEPGLLNQIFLLEKRLNNIQILLANHIFTSNILKMIESKTHPQVRFLNFNMSVSGYKIDTVGEAASYSTLARQIALLENTREIERVEFGGLSLGANNLLNFKLTIIFKQALLQLRP